MLRQREWPGKYLQLSCAVPSASQEGAPAGFVSLDAYVARHRTVLNRNVSTHRVGGLVNVNRSLSKI